MSRLTNTDEGLSPCALFDEGTDWHIRFGPSPRHGAPVLVFQYSEWNFPPEEEGAALQPLYKHYLRFVGISEKVQGVSVSSTFADDLELPLRGSEQELFITVPSGEAVFRLVNSMMSADYMQLLDKKRTWCANTRATCQST